MASEEASQGASDIAGAGAGLAIAAGLPFVGFGLAAVQVGLQFSSAKRAKAKSRRAARQQQTRNNRELIRRAQALGEQEARVASTQSLAVGSAGIRGGGAVAASLSKDLADQRRLDQELLLRGVDESLQKGAARLGLFGNISENLNEFELEKKNAPFLAPARAALAAQNELFPGTSV